MIQDGSKLDKMLILAATSRRENAIIQNYAPVARDMVTMLRAQ